MPGPAPPDAPAVTDGRLPEARVDGARVMFAPAADAEAALPLYPASASMALPRAFGPGEPPLPILSPAGSDASVRAVYLVRVREDRYQPAVLLPRRSERPWVVAIAALRPVRDAAGTERLGLGPRTVDTDRHRLVLVQPGEVVVLDVRSVRTLRIPVPDTGLLEAGWALDGRTVVARSATQAWLVDTRTSAVTRAGGPVETGWAGIRVTAGTVFVQAFSPAGRLTGVRSVSGPDLEVSGPSVSNIEGWACRAATLVSGSGVGRRDGLVAVQGDLRPSPRFLAAPEGSTPPAYRPLVWGPRDTLLLESRVGETTRVLAWDVIGGRLHRVGQVAAATEDAAVGFTGAWCL